MSDVAAGLRQIPDKTWASEIVIRKNVDLYIYIFININLMTYQMLFNHRMIQIASMSTHRHRNQLNDIFLGPARRWGIVAGIQSVIGAM